MCAVSNVGDRFRDRWHDRPWYPQVQPAGPLIYPPLSPPVISREEFDALKADVAEMKELLKAAKTQDDAEGTPLCENADKMEVLRAVAKLVGVSLDDVLGPPAIK